jgi:protein-S-isoprenylcysteine O-methyltransferase Ste14
MSEQAQTLNTAPKVVQTIARLTEHLSQDFLGGPRPWKLSWVINFQKGGTFLFIGLMMLLYGNNSPAAWLYLALHGSYGFVWLLKDVCFPDPRWQQRVTVAGGLVSFFTVLAWYWLIGWLLVSGTVDPTYPLAEPAWFALCVSLCILGSVIMMVADAQKYYTLKVQRGLIRDGIHRYIRHPNYLGEMMIYGSFALLVWHWIPALILAFIWSALFAVNMIMKEGSLARYSDWADYKKRSWWLIPYIL